MERNAHHAHAVTLLITAIGAACCIVQAAYPFRGVFEFITVQVTFVAGALTYARSVRWLLDAGQAVKARLILRGNVVVLASVAATLIFDSIAMKTRVLPESATMGVAALGVLTLAAVTILAAVFRSIPRPRPPQGLTIADGLDDVLTLVRWAAPIEADSLFAQLRPLNPRLHPWGFATLLGFGAGIAFFLAHLQEGLPPNIRTGLAVGGIFVGIECVLTLLGFVALGPYLGLHRPLK